MKLFSAMRAFHGRFSPKKASEGMKRKSFYPKGRGATTGQGLPQSDLVVARSPDVSRLCHSGRPQVSPNPSPRHHAIGVIGTSTVSFHPTDTVPQKKTANARLTIPDRCGKDSCGSVLTNRNADMSKWSNLLGGGRSLASHLDRLRRVPCFRGPSAICIIFQTKQGRESMTAHGELASLSQTGLCEGTMLSRPTRLG